MTLVGIKFLDKPLKIKSFADLIMQNSEKPVAKILFNVKAYCIESDILVINKEFIASKTMQYVFLFMSIGCAIPWFFWNVRSPMFALFFLIILFGLFQSPAFNFLMFKIMIKRTGYKGKVVML